LKGKITDIELNSKNKHIRDLYRGITEFKKGYHSKINLVKDERDRLCGLVVSVADYKHRGPGFDSRALLRIFLKEFGLERGPLSLVIG
jgi:hypothetical protein